MISDDVIPGYFRRSGDSAGSLTPIDDARSGWGADHMRGSAVTGALARSAQHAGAMRPDLRPARFTVDLNRVAAMAPVTTRSTVLREGRRLLLVDTELHQKKGIVARSRTLFLPASDTSDDVPDLPWAPDRMPGSPPADLVPATSEGRLFHSDGVGWTADARDHRNASRKQLWCRPFPVVDGEPTTGFLDAAMTADLTNLVTHWSSTGVRFINADVTLVLARPPAESGTGLSATGRVGSGQVSVATAEIYDRAGVLGYTSISSVRQSTRPVDTVAQLMRGTATGRTPGEKT